MPQFARASRRRRYCGAIPASQPTRSQPRPDAVLSIGELALLSSAGGLGKSTLVAAELVSAALLPADREPLTIHHGGEVQPQLPASPADACSCRSWSVWKNSTPLSRSTSKHQAARHCACCYRRARRAAGFATRQACRIAKLPDRAW